jgi:hypothetical protein
MAIFQAAAVVSPAFIVSLTDLRYCLEKQIWKYNIFNNFVLPERELQARSRTEVHLV